MWKRTVYVVNGTVARDCPQRTCGVELPNVIKKGERVLFEFRNGRQFTTMTRPDGVRLACNTSFFRDEVEDVRIVPVDADPALWAFCHESVQTRYVVTEDEALGRLKMVMGDDHEFLDKEAWEKAQDAMKEIPCSSST
jgi:hypothetical protein